MVLSTAGTSPTSPSASIRTFLTCRHRRSATGCAGESTASGTRNPSWWPTSGTTAQRPADAWPADGSTCTSTTKGTWNPASSATSQSTISRTRSSWMPLPLISSGNQGSAALRAQPPAPLPVGRPPRSGEARGQQIWSLPHAPRSRFTHQGRAAGGPACLCTLPARRLRSGLGKGVPLGGGMVIFRRKLARAHSRRPRRRGAAQPTAGSSREALRSAGLTLHSAEPPYWTRQSVELLLGVSACGCALLPVCVSRQPFLRPAVLLFPDRCVDVAQAACVGT